MLIKFVLPCGREHAFKKHFCFWVWLVLYSTQRQNILEYLKWKTLCLNFIIFALRELSQHIPKRVLTLSCNTRFEKPLPRPWSLWAKNSLTTDPAKRIKHKCAFPKILFSSQRYFSLLFPNAPLQKSSILSCVLLLPSLHPAFYFFKDTQQKQFSSDVYQILNLPGITQNI